MGNVVPFPVSRRMRFIDDHVTRTGYLSGDAAERRIARVCATYRADLARLGVDETIANAETAALEGRIRSGLWRTILRGGER